MTSELKPFLEDMLSMSTGTDGRTLQIHFCRPVTMDDRLALMNAHNAAVTRAVPDVPELVRYSAKVNRKFDADGEVIFYVEFTEDIAGEYVRFDPVAKLLADKDELVMRIDRFAQTYRRHMLNADQRVTEVQAERDALKDDRFDGLWRFWNNKARELSQRNVALSAELAQIKAQEPVGSYEIESGEVVSTTDFYDDKFPYPDGDLLLYAAPVDQTAEIERLREAIEFYADKTKWDSGGFEHGLSDDGGHNVLTLIMSDIDKDRGDTARAALSGKSPS